MRFTELFVPLYGRSPPFVNPPCSEGAIRVLKNEETCQICFVFKPGENALAENSQEKVLIYVWTVLNIVIKKRYRKNENSNFRNFSGF